MLLLFCELATHTHTLPPRHLTLDRSGMPQARSRPATPRPGRPTIWASTRSPRRSLKRTCRSKRQVQRSPLPHDPPLPPNPTVKFLRPCLIAHRRQHDLDGCRDLPADKERFFLLACL
jgi:hypothetical protein